MLPARCERVATSFNRTVSGDTFRTLSSLDKPVDRSVSLWQSFELVYAQVMRRKNVVFRWSNGSLCNVREIKELYGNECLSRTKVFEWFKRFKEGRETAEEDPRPGRPSMSKTNENIEKIGKLIREDRRLSIRGLC
ncbi:hypothetical protein NQ318_013372 [Aromia moschata]|uniref:Mos1 transposase HTH domain-containing protein n=1 Tax=Aromia moschata TaxID=1265417 RepID=A0AAV8XVZ7_9CUCU|nr:hypothetical protein NQ318_013372 [Aromia moschata]